MIITVLQLTGLFIIMGFAGHLYVEMEKIVKASQEHIKRLDQAVDEYIAKRDAKADSILDEIESYE